MQARVTDANGALSDYSNKAVTIVITPLFLRIGKAAIDYLTLSLMLLSRIFAKLLGSIWLCGKIRRRLKKIGKNRQDAEIALQGI